MPKLTETIDRLVTALADDIGPNATCEVVRAQQGVKVRHGVLGGRVAEDRPTKGRARVNHLRRGTAAHHAERR